MTVRGNITINDVVTSIQILQDENEIIRLDYDEVTNLITTSSEPQFSIEVEEFAVAIQVINLWSKRIAKIPFTGTHRGFICEFNRKSSPPKIEGSFSFEEVPKEFATTHEFEEDTGSLTVKGQTGGVITPVEFFTIFGLFEDTLLIKDFPQS